MTFATPTTESCATCVFWKRDSAGGAIHGACRLRPPQQIEGPTSTGYRYFEWRQPHTLESDWCGEHWGVDA